MNSIIRAAADGYGCLSSWSDLLDRINVFPVADSDTGTNLRISLAPLQQTGIEQEDLPDLLARSATGISGNIAAAFLQDFLQAKDNSQLPDAALCGRDRARQAVLDVLEVRFGEVPWDIRERIMNTESLPLLEALHKESIRCKDLDMFRDILDKVGDGSSDSESA